MGVPRNVMELPGINLDWAIKLLQHAWDSYSEQLVVSQSEGVYIVGWKEVREKVGKEQRVVLTGVSIPSPVVDALKKLP